MRAARPRLLSPARALRASSPTSPPRRPRARALRRASWSSASSSARPWPSLSAPLLDQLEHLVGQVEQAQQVADRDPAAPDTAADLLARQAELLHQRRAGARLLDRVEVLARHVLDQRQPRAPRRRRARARARGSSPARRAAPRASGARRRRARSVPPGFGRTSTGCSTPALAERGRQRLQRLLVEVASRLPAGSATISSTGSSRSSSRRRCARGVDTDRIAPRPLPIPGFGLATGGHLLGQLEIGLRAGAVRVVVRDRQPIARRLSDAHVARNHGVEDELGEVRRAPRARRPGRAACARRASSAASRRPSGAGSARAARARASRAAPPVPRARSTRSAPARSPGRPPPARTPSAARATAGSRAGCTRNVAQRRQALAAGGARSPRSAAARCSRRPAPAPAGSTRAGDRRVDQRLRGRHLACQHLVETRRLRPRRSRGRRLRSPADRRRPAASSSRPRRCTRRRSPRSSSCRPRPSGWRPHTPCPRGRASAGGDAGGRPASNGGTGPACTPSGFCVHTRAGKRAGSPLVRRRRAGGDLGAANGRPASRPLSPSCSAPQTPPRSARLRRPRQSTSCRPAQQRCGVLEHNRLRRKRPRAVTRSLRRDPLAPFLGPGSDHTRVPDPSPPHTPARGTSHLRRWLSTRLTQRPAGPPRARGPATPPRAEVGDSARRPRPRPARVPQRVRDVHHPPRVVSRIAVVARCSSVSSMPEQRRPVALAWGQFMALSPAQIGRSSSLTQVAGEEIGVLRPSSRAPLPAYVRCRVVRRAPHSTTGGLPQPAQLLGPSTGSSCARRGSRGRTARAGKRSSNQRTRAS